MPDIEGAVLMGKRYKIEAPVNETIIDIVKMLENR